MTIANSSAIHDSAELCRFGLAAGDMDSFMAFSARERRYGNVYHLYKYRSLNLKDTNSIKRARSMIVLDRIWLSKASSFNDSFDGKFTLSVEKNAAKVRAAMDRNKHIFQHIPPGKRVILLERLRRTRVIPPEVEKNFRTQFNDDEGMFCATATPRSSLMWSHYAYNHTGFCLQYAVYEDPLLSLMQPVCYSPDFPTRTLLSNAPGRNQSYLQKSPEWSYEQEWRSVALTGDCEVRLHNRAVAGIIFGARIDPAVKQTLLQMVNERMEAGKRPLTIYQAYLSDMRYSIGIFHGGAARPSNWAGRPQLPGR